MLTPIGSGLFMIQSITTTPSVAEETTQIKLCPLRKKKNCYFHDGANLARACVEAKIGCFGSDDENAIGLCKISKASFSYPD